MLRHCTNGFLLLLLLQGSMGCNTSLYGEGSLYFWNGTSRVVKVKVEGRSNFEASLPPETGRLIEGLVAGDYSRSEDGKVKPDFALPKEHFVIINVDGKGCFARNDVAGMYKRGREPVRVLETYSSADIIDIADIVQIKPGERMPMEAPRTHFTFQRVVVLPCAMLEDHNDDSADEIAQYVRRLR